MTKIVYVVYIVEKLFCYLFHDGFTVLTADDAEMQYWTCGYRGLCRRFCYAQEYIVGHHGCPRRYRYMNDLFEMYTCNVLYHVYCLRDLDGVWSALSDIHNNSSMLDFCCSDVTRFCAISWSFKFCWVLSAKKYLRGLFAQALTVFLFIICRCCAVRF